MMFKVLQVNDDARRATLISEALEQVGYEISGQLKTSDDLLLRVEKDNPDVIVIDTEIPDMDYLKKIRMLNQVMP
ncbi:MAG: response regulator, partial [Gammaproteobacteria bacterium]|nr:response regulator [Gammaproteobacteria bacterium]